MQLVQCARRYPFGPCRYPCCCHLHGPFRGHGRATATVWGVPNYPVLYMPIPCRLVLRLDSKNTRVVWPGRWYRSVLTASVE